MRPARFDPESPAPVGSRMRINSGQFEGYTGEVSRLDGKGRAVYFTIVVFDRPVELSLDYDTAAEILDVEASWSAEPGAAADRGRHDGSS